MSEPSPPLGREHSTRLVGLRRSLARIGLDRAGAGHQFVAGQVLGEGDDQASTHERRETWCPPTRNIAVTPMTITEAGRRALGSRKG